MDLKKRLEQRFLKYSAISSQSDGSNETIPSSIGQWKMAETLAEDLKDLGVQDVEIGETGVVYGRLPERLSPGHKPVPKVGWCCHMDTVDVHLSPEVHARVVREYPGGDVLQNEEKQIYIREYEHPELRDYIGQDIIVSDGTSVLGRLLRSSTARFTWLSYLMRKQASEGRNPWISASFPWISHILSTAKERARWSIRPLTQVRRS